MAADALVSCGTRPSAAMVLTMLDEKVILSSKRKYLRFLRALSQCRIYIYIVAFPIILRHWDRARRNHIYIYSCISYHFTTLRYIHVSSKQFSACRVKAQGSFWARAHSVRKCVTMFTTPSLIGRAHTQCEWFLKPKVKFGVFISFVVINLVFVYCWYVLYDLLIVMF